MCFPLNCLNLIFFGEKLILEESSLGKQSNVIFRSEGMRREVIMVGLSFEGGDAMGGGRRRKFPFSLFHDGEVTVN